MLNLRNDDGSLPRSRWTHQPGRAHLQSIPNEGCLQAIEVEVLQLQPHEDPRLKDRHLHNVSKAFESW